MAVSSQNLFGQLLLPLQGVVDFFSPPSSATLPKAPSVSGYAIGIQPRLAKAPTLPQQPRTASEQIKIQPAGIRLHPESGPRLSQGTGVRLVGQGLMGHMAETTAGSTSTAQILRSRRTQDGRIVISGRMRDVCAELDRLCDEPA